jgi:ATP-dependent protease HslVU (ClpYQ) peptidase subunit
MTCIVAVTDGNTVVMGADSLISYGGLGSPLAEATGKIFYCGPFLIGVCGSVRFVQILRECFTAPLHTGAGEIVTFLVREFVPALKRTLHEHGWLHNANGQDETGCDQNRSLALIAHGGRLFLLQADFSVIENRDGYEAIGSGDELALGAVFAMRRENATPWIQVETALAAASKFSTGCGEPFEIRQVETPAEVD